MAGLGTVAPQFPYMLFVWTGWFQPVEASYAHGRVHRLRRRTNNNHHHNHIHFFHYIYIQSPLAVERMLPQHKPLIPPGVCTYTVQEQPKATLVAALAHDFYNRCNARISAGCRYGNI